MSKRKRFTITSLILSLGFLGINLLDFQFRFIAIGVLTLATLILFIWSLWEGLGKNATLLTLILPPMFTLGVGLFWFLLPSTIIARLPVVLVYGLGIYSLCLTTNIFTVSAIRTIALARAARGVGFVLTLVVGFLMYDAILSLKIHILGTVLIASFVSFPLYLQGLWTSKLDHNLKIDSSLTYSLMFSLCIAQVAALLYFWPVTVVVGSLFLTVILYILLGLGQAQLEDRLFGQTVREYMFVGLVVFITIFVATRWGG